MTAAEQCGERERKEKTGKSREKNLRCNGDASVKDVGLWELSVYCVYYTVSREDPADFVQ